MLTLTPEQSVVAAIALCLAGAPATWLVSRHRAAAGGLALAFTAATAVLVLEAVGKVLGGGAGQPAEFLRLPALGFALRIHVDGLSAWFLLLAAAIAVPAMAYSIPYMRHYPNYSVARYYPFFLLFLAAMYGLVTTTDMMWFFFIFWQMMTLAGYGLIRFENRVPANLRAAWKFLVMMQIACALTMGGAELLAATGAAAGGNALKYDFNAVSSHVPALLQSRPHLAAAAFGLFLAGFGIKLGMWPFGQVWLPDAHPAAPSPVSAMLSGVMIKTGVYGIMRYFLWLVPSDALAAYPMRAWGAVIAGLGTVTLLAGTLQALRQEQTKRLLAFHSIGQVGYILLGIGACLALLPAPTPFGTALATLAFLGALFHTLNHGLFKSLLFLNAGSMLWASGTQDLNKLGGLMRFMPLTAATTLVASFSISGVPLFNGFASKWSLYVATLQAGDAAPYLVFCGVAAILTSVLTLASFIKFSGATLFTRTSPLVLQQARHPQHAPRPDHTPQAATRHETGRPGRLSLEVPWTMQWPQAVLAGACVLLGVAPALGFDAMHRVLAASHTGAGTLLAQTAPVQAGIAKGLNALNGAAWFVPAALLPTLALLLLAAYALSRLGGSARRTDESWYCGYAREADRHRYAAHGFYGEIKRYVRWIGGSPDANPHPRPPPARTRPPDAGAAANLEP
ncbi:MAG: peroxiredoxin family protein [Verrucomicrobia bacterium]|nr:peroxiredoxin family protein [Verrucomicrobiota bacterium]